MPDVVARTLLTQRLNVILISSFSLLALVLAGLGVYGVVSHLTTLRFREFGVRLAIGAKPAGLLAMVLRQTLTSASVGLGAGILLSVAVTRLLKMTIHAVAPIDPFTYMLAVVLLLIVVVAASYIPARKASRIDPASILRND